MRQLTMQKHWNQHATEAWKYKFIAAAETCKQQKQGSMEVADLWNHVSSSSNSSTTWKQQIYG